MQESADVEGSKTDTLEVKRRNRSSQRFALVEQFTATVGIRLLFDDGDEVANTCLGNLFGICSVRHNRLTNLPNFRMSING